MWSVFATCSVRQWWSFVDYLSVMDKELLSASTLLSKHFCQSFLCYNDEHWNIFWKSLTLANCWLVNSEANVKVPSKPVSSSVPWGIVTVTYRVKYIVFQKHNICPTNCLPDLLFLFISLKLLSFILYPQCYIIAILI